MNINSFNQQLFEDSKEFDCNQAVLHLKSAISNIEASAIGSNIGAALHSANLAIEILRMIASIEKLEQRNEGKKP